MLMDATLLFNTTAPLLTGLVAATPGYSDTIDLTTARDVGTANMPFFVVFTTLPTSATGGSTINAALQTSPDNATWTTLEETAPQPLANYTAMAPFLFRGTIPTGCSRYLRVAYTASAVLTTGAVQATIGAAWPHSRAYPRNYVA